MFLDMHCKLNDALHALTVTSTYLLAFNPLV